MKQEIAKKWAEALRSGDYTQGQKCLKDVDSNFCCLGVLCDLFMHGHPERKDVFWDWDPNTGAIVLRSPPDASRDDAVQIGYLSEVVRDWAGMNTADGSFPDDLCAALDKRYDRNYMHSLTMINDEDIPFEEIADIIEENAAVL